jgi:hypothetical protein
MAQEAALFGDNIPPKLEIPYILKYVVLIIIHFTMQNKFFSVAYKYAFLNQLLTHLLELGLLS